MSFAELAQELYYYNWNPELTVAPGMAISMAQNPLAQISHEIYALAPALLLRARNRMRINLTRELSVKVATRPATRPTPPL